MNIFSQKQIFFFLSVFDLKTMSSDNIFIPWLRSPFTCHWKHPGFLMIHASPLWHTSVLLHCSICTFYLPKIFSYQSFEEDF